MFCSYLWLVLTVKTNILNDCQMNDKLLCTAIKIDDLLHFETSIDTILEKNNRILVTKRQVTRIPMNRSQPNAVL